MAAHFEVCCGHFNLHIGWRPSVSFILPNHRTKLAGFYWFRTLRTERPNSRGSILGKISGRVSKQFANKCKTQNIWYSNLEKKCISCQKKIISWHILHQHKSRDSSVGIATGYGLNDHGDGSSSPGRVKIFHFSISSRPTLGSTQRPIKWVPGAKRQGLETDHSPPTSAEVKKMWIYTSTPLYVFMA
jgi:hypothetical protein